MFKHLLIPLDGSCLAESALPVASALGQALGASVTLLHAVERDAPHEIHGERHLASAAEARVYLSEVAARAFPSGLHVDRCVQTDAAGDVARSIVAYSRDSGADLIVMCTHGQGGLRSRLYGNIAQQVVALGATPVLLTRPTATEMAPSFACRHLLVPLDGEAEHEQALSVAIDLAHACRSVLHLVMVVPTPQTLSRQGAATARLLPSATSAILDMTLDGGQGYLNDHLSQLQAEGLSATADVLRGDPTTLIVSAADRVEADLIVLATHRKKGADAFWSQSVAPQVSNQCDRPLLLVPLR